MGRSYELCEDCNELYAHLKMLGEAELIEGADRALTNAHGYLPKRVTWAGHDFLDSIRDDEIWEKTKEGAEAAGGFTVDLLKDLAKGFIKEKIKKHTGV